MHRQVGDLQIVDGIARRGLLVRHLVLPGGQAGTAEIAQFLAGEVSPNTYLNVMAQYQPCYKASDISHLSRRLSATEFSVAIDMARRQGLNRLDERQAVPLLRPVIG